MADDCAGICPRNVVFLNFLFEGSDGFILSRLEVAYPLCFCQAAFQFEDCVLRLCLGKISGDSTGDPCDIVLEGG